MTRASLAPTPCPLCAGPGEPRHELEDHWFHAPGRFCMRRCARCRLSWLSPPPGEAELARSYAGYHTHAAPDAPSLLQRQLRRAIPALTLGYVGAPASRLELVLARALARIGPLREAALRSVMGLEAGSRGRLLDVGCGSGLMLRTFRDLGWEVLGLEPDPAAVAQARSGLGQDAVVEGTLPRPDWDDGSFDAILGVHVIEHLRDPRAALVECRRLLRPAGRIALATPNGRSLGSERFGARWRGFEPPRHLHVFEPESLTRLARNAGLRETCVLTPTSAAPPIWLESAGRSGPVAQLRAVGFWLREYARVRRGAAVGEEILLVAEKPA